MNNPFKEITEKLNSIEALLLEIQEEKAAPEPSDPMRDYIAKAEVTGVLAAGSTLWRYEKEGKLPVYGVGGKRYYKRKDIENLFTRLKK